MHTETLSRQMAFLCEIEKLKTVYRQNMVIDKTRQENSAEHSWHLALMALILKDHAVNSDIDVLRVIKMVLVHDLVEIDAGDTFLYDETGNSIRTRANPGQRSGFSGFFPRSNARSLRLCGKNSRSAKPRTRFSPQRSTTCNP